MTTILDDLQSALSSTPQRWISLVEHFREDELRKRPLEGEWCALEVLQHLIEVEIYVFPVRVKAILAGENFIPYNTDAMVLPEDSNPSAMVAQFQQLRTESLKIVAELKEADLSKSVEHPMFGVVTMSELLHEWAGHDLMHTVQAEQALLQRFIRGCGPFEVYFEKHKAVADS